MIRLVTAVLLAGLLTATAGCVAAAIPLAAGGLLAKSRLQASRTATDPPAGAQATPAGGYSVTRLALTELPPPDALVPQHNPTVAAFREYALAQLQMQPAGGKRASALLSRASELRADRTHCTATPPAVFIDLDPGRGAFDPLAPGKPDRSLAAALDELRGQGVAVVWFSRLGAGFEPAVRAALAEADFDSAESDRLVLLSDLGERKQTRRGDMAKEVCPIALLGDERADFDELYLYLKQPDTAIALDAMIGRGWFLARPFEPAAEPMKEPVP